MILGKMHWSVLFEMMCAIAQECAEKHIFHSLMVNMVPRPSSLSMVMLPPCFKII